MRHLIYHNHNTHRPLSCSFRHAFSASVNNGSVLVMKVKHSANVATRVYCDSQAAIAGTKNPGNKRAKHIDIKYHWVRMQVKEKIVEFVYCSSDDNVADLLTKSLTESKTVKFRSGMMGCARSEICNAVVVGYRQLPG